MLLALSGSLLYILFCIHSFQVTIIVVKLKLALSKNEKIICIPREHSSPVLSTGFLYDVLCVASTKRYSDHIFKRNSDTLLYQYFTTAAGAGVTVGDSDGSDDHSFVPCVSSPVRENHLRGR